MAYQNAHLIELIREKLNEINRVLTEIESVLPNLNDDNFVFDLPSFDVTDDANVSKLFSTENADIEDLARIKKSIIGKLYIRIFKRFLIFRYAAKSLWVCLYPKYVEFIRVLKGAERRKWFDLISLKDYSKINGLDFHNLTEKISIKTSHPVFWPEEDAKDICAPHEELKFDPVYLVTLTDARVYGATNIVYVGDFAIHHDQINLQHDYTSEELHGRMQVDLKKRRLKNLTKVKEIINLSECAAFTDACASNYAHWMTEVLPRVALFCQQDQFKSIPIIVDSGLHKNILRSLHLVVGEQREIVELPSFVELKVKKLHCVSVAGYVPFQERTRKISSESHGYFNPVAMRMMKKILDENIVRRSDINWPEKVYINRVAGGRKISNARAIEEILKSNGFSSVRPEFFSFDDQYQIFSNAKIIVGSTGAAMANIVFAAESSKLVIFIGKVSGTKYWYWQNIRDSVGGIVCYFLSKPLNLIDGIHSDITVPVKELEGSNALNL